MNKNSKRTMPYRILILDTEFEMGGKEKKLFDFIRRADRSRFQIAVCCLMRGGYFKSKLEALGVPFYDNLLRNPYDALAFRSLRAVIRAEKTQIIYTFSHPSTVIFAYLARLSGLVERFIVSYHATGREEGGRMIPTYLLPMLRRADLLLAVAEMQKDHLVRAEGLPADKIRVIHNGVDTIAYHPADAHERARARHELGLAPDSVVLVSVASLKPAKNIDVLLRAAAKLADARPRRTGSCWSETGPIAALSSRWRRALGVRDRVVFAGIRDDIPRDAARRRRARARRRMGHGNVSQRRPRSNGERSRGRLHRRGQRARDGGGGAQRADRSARRRSGAGSGARARRADDPDLRQTAWVARGREITEAALPYRGRCARNGKRSSKN